LAKYPNKLDAKKKCVSSIKETHNIGTFENKQKGKSQIRIVPYNLA
jgi:hypothetical protein